MTDTTLLMPACITIGIGAMFSMLKQFHMLQQNSYYPSRYVNWIYDSYFSRIAILAVFFCFLSIACRHNMVIELIAAVAYALVMIASGILSLKKSIKKLVFTARVKRLFVAAILIITALILCVHFTTELIKGIFFSLFLLICVFSPLLTLLCFAVTYPAEKAVAKYYINDAKKILRGCHGLRVIGVTGSYGKTGTKFILSRILSEKYNVLSTPHSFNTPLGVVRTIRENLRAATDIFVCEMGAKNKGDIKEICDIVKPNMGIITSVGPQHLETFKTVENVFSTKFELYDACKKSGGNVFVNADSAEIAARIGKKDVSSYGISSGDIKATDISYSENGSSFNICTEDTVIPVKTKLLGKHNVLNITGAAAIALSLGVEPENIRFAVSKLEQTEHRLELKPYHAGSVVIDDAYNSNPEGCIEALNVLSAFKNKKKVLITPGLVELGEKEYDFNFKFGLAAANICDIIIFVGKKRSVPLSDAVKTTDFDLSKMHIASSFAEADGIYRRFADNDTVLLIENDLPDNYLN